jgi:hypothetical protein
LTEEGPTGIREGLNTLAGIPLLRAQMCSMLHQLTLLEKEVRKQAASERAKSASVHCDLCTQVFVDATAAGPSALLVGSTRTVYRYTVYDHMFGESPTKNTVYTPYIQYGPGQLYLFGTCESRSLSFWQ